MLLLNIERGSRQPIFRQIALQIRQKIENRVLSRGERLPSTRRLAESLGIHRSTVALAYQELWGLGFIEQTPGARPRVRERKCLVPSPGAAGKGLVDWGAVASPASDFKSPATMGLHPQPLADGKGGIDFARLDMDPRLFPLDAFRTCLNRVIRRDGRSLLGYGDAAGFAPLREYIARRLRRHGVNVDAGEILLTSGAQQGIDLVFRLLAAPGRGVVIESPTYPNVFPLLHFYGLRPLEIPMLGDGMDLSLLKEVLRHHHPLLVYTMPNFQNPTGVSTSQSHREQLLSLCESRRIPILEDGFEEEMKYSGRVVLPIKSMDRSHLVIYCGTFSKVLFPGVRIGWIAAERGCIERLVAIRRACDLSPSIFVQAALREFCAGGHYDLHVSRMHRIYRRRMQAALAALRRHVSFEWAEWTEPSGGYLIWLKLRPASTAVRDWEGLIAGGGVRVVSGRHFFYSAPAAPYLRLSLSTLDEGEIGEGIRRLGLALEQAFSRLRRQDRVR